MREKTNIEYESQLLFPDGSTKNIRIVAHPVVNSDGDVVQFVGTTIDVTEQHRAKAALESALTEVRKSEVRLRTIIDTIPAMAWCALPDGFAEFHNQRWLDYTGLSDEEGRGWDWRTAIHPEDSQAAIDEWRDIESAQTHRARVRSLLSRASDTTLRLTLRLLGTDPRVIIPDRP
jgi:PAS domain-containing protein